jgi:hypothetical protein
MVGCQRFKALNPDKTTSACPGAGAVIVLCEVRQERILTHAPFLRRSGNYFCLDYSRVNIACTC